MKDTFYFSHDYNTRSDDKIKLLIRKHGMLGYGIFWAIIEDLYNNANAMRSHYECIAYDLRIDENIIKSIINDFDLFVVCDGFFSSESVGRRISDRNEKSAKARKSANSKWEKIRENANALKNDANVLKNDAIKERKEKKIKKENSKEKVSTSVDERKKVFYDSLIPFLETYQKSTLGDFFRYWSEVNRSNTKMRFELEKTWQTNLRLKTWASREKIPPGKNGSTSQIKKVESGGFR